MGKKWKLKQPARYQQEIKKSIFIAQAVFLSSESALPEQIKALSNPEARHNCWAYRVGDIYRFDDANEPGGTAGRPILQVIDAQNMDYILVVVSRWFGGIKLGAGGLIRAYGGTAAACLREAEKEVILALVSISVECSFQAHSFLHSRCSAFSAQIESEEFMTDSVRISLTLPEDQLPAFQVFFRDLTRGQGQLHILKNTAFPKE